MHNIYDIGNVYINIICGNYILNKNIKLYLTFSYNLIED